MILPFRTLTCITAIAHGTAAAAEIATARDRILAVWIVAVG